MDTKTKPNKSHHSCMIHCLNVLVLIHVIKGDLRQLDRRLFLALTCQFTPDLDNFWNGRHLISYFTAKFFLGLKT